MPTKTKKTPGNMARPPAENPKNAILNFRTYAAVREAIEEFARNEHRTLAAMSDLLVREAIIARRKATGENTDDIESLP